MRTTLNIDDQLVDINLLASVKITGNLIWTRDKRLNEIAVEMNLAV